MPDSTNTPALPELEAAKWIRRQGEPVKAVQWTGSNWDEIHAVYPGLGEEYMRDKGACNGFFVINPYPGTVFFMDPHEFHNRYEPVGESTLARLAEALQERDEALKSAMCIRRAWCKEFVTPPIADLKERWACMDEHRKSCWQKFRGEISKSGMNYVNSLRERLELSEAELTEARTLLANQAAEIERLREKDVMGLLRKIRSFVWAEGYADQTPVVAELCAFIETVESCDEEHPTPGTN